MVKSVVKKGIMRFAQALFRIAQNMDEKNIKRVLHEEHVQVLSKKHPPMEMKRGFSMTLGIDEEIKRIKEQKQYE
jgi:hypothetical protein